MPTPETSSENQKWVHVASHTNGLDLTRLIFFAPQIYVNLFRKFIPVQCHVLWFVAKLEGYPPPSTGSRKLNGLDKNKFTSSIRFYQLYANYYFSEQESTLVLDRHLGTEARIGIIRSKITLVRTAVALL